MGPPFALLGLLLYWVFIPQRSWKSLPSPVLNYTHTHTQTFFESRCTQCTSTSLVFPEDLTQWKWCSILPCLYKMIFSPDTLSFIGSWNSYDRTCQVNHIPLACWAHPWLDRGRWFAQIHILESFKMQFNHLPCLTILKEQHSCGLHRETTKKILWGVVTEFLQSWQSLHLLPSL